MFDIPSFSTQCADCSTSQVSNGTSDLLASLGFDSTQIGYVTSAISANPVSPSVMQAKVTELASTANTDVLPAAQYEVNEEAKADEPKKGNSSVNGKVSDPVYEPINAYKVSSPKDIPNNNNSLEEVHPDSFGSKDRAGNFFKHNLMTGLYQRGLKNGYLFRSDVNGNTTVFVPANFKLRTGKTFNINAAAMDMILSGQLYIDSNEKVTIKAPNIEIIGALKVNGTQVNTSTISADGAISTKATMSAAVDGTMGGKSFLSHTHPAPGGTTGIVN